MRPNSVDPLPQRPICMYLCMYLCMYVPTFFVSKAPSIVDFRKTINHKPYTIFGWSGVWFMVYGSEPWMVRPLSEWISKTINHIEIFLNFKLKSKNSTPMQIWCQLNRVDSEEFKRSVATLVSHNRRNVAMKWLYCTTPHRILIESNRIKFDSDSTSRDRRRDVSWFRSFVPTYICMYSCMYVVIKST